MNEDNGFDAWAISHETQLPIAPMAAPDFPSTGFLSNGSDAEQLAQISSFVTVEMTRLLTQLQEIMEGFKQAVAEGGQIADGELGISLGGILSSVEEIRDQMGKTSSLAVAMSSARLAKMAESLRLEMRSILKPKTPRIEPLSDMGKT